MPFLVLAGNIVQALAILLKLPKNPCTRQRFVSVSSRGQTDCAAYEHLALTFTSQERFVMNLLTLEVMECDEYCMKLFLYMSYPP
jgi:hypothetical protein